MRLERLTKAQQDELFRISRQGLRQAAEVLSRLVRQPVAVEVAEAWMSDCRPAEQSCDSYLGVCMQVSGDINGGLLLALPESCADWLSELLLGHSETQNLLEEPASSTLKEVGNIIASSFLACLDDQFGLRAMPSPPQLKSAPLDQLLQDCQADRDEACLVVRTRLSGAAAAGGKLQGSIFLFPDSAALKKLLAQIGNV